TKIYTFSLHDALPILKFTLNEIKTIFLFRRLGKLTPYQEYEYYKAFYKNKYDSICQEVESLRDAKNKLQMKMKELVVKENKQKRSEEHTSELQSRENL